MIDISCIKKPSLLLEHALNYVTEMSGTKRNMFGKHANLNMLSKVCKNIIHRLRKFIDTL